MAENESYTNSSNNMKNVTKIKIFFYTVFKRKHPILK